MMITTLNKAPGYVLVVGEELLDRNSLTEMLNRWGYYVLFANNSLNALKLLSDIRPMAILIGFVEGNPDRQTFTKILKNDQSTSDIHVVAISEENVSLDGLMPIGFDGFITVRDRLQDMSADLQKILFNK
ncbi:MAG: hypothetical protein ACJ77K_09360 [Bacteroidia bacterium]